MLNLDELARVAKKYGLSVRVTGAADNSTGTTDINDSLSVSRAAYIATELEHRGIPTDCITQASKGGIADYVPIEANRHEKIGSSVGIDKETVTGRKATGYVSG